MTNRRVCPISFHFIEVPPPQNILYGLCVKILWICSDVSSYIIVLRNSDIKAKLLWDIMLLFYVSSLNSCFYAWPKILKILSSTSWLPLLQYVGTSRNINLNFRFEMFPWDDLNLFTHNAASRICFFVLSRSVLFSLTNPEKITRHLGYFERNIPTAPRRILMHGAKVGRKVRLMFPVPNKKTCH